MGLQQDYTFKGVVVTDAYHRISNRSGDDQLHVDIMVYKDKALSSLPLLKAFLELIQEEGTRHTVLYPLIKSHMFGL